MIDSIIYFMIQIHFDIYFIVIILSHYNQNLNIKHYAVVKRVIRYLKNIMNHEIIYEMIDELKDYTNVN